MRLPGRRHVSSLQCAAASLLLAASGCAASNIALTCRAGRELVTGPAASVSGEESVDSSAQWCEESLPGKGTAKNGPHLATYSSGSKVASGSFRDDVPDGVWTFWYETGGRRLSGTMQNGVENGTWTSWYEDGTKQAEIHYAAGKPNGLTTTWHPNGVKALEQSYRNGDLHGRWVRYEPDGHLRVEGVIDTDTNTATETWYYPDGTKSARYHYKGEKRHGVFEAWHTNGAPSIVGRYRDGEKVGKWHRWDESGSELPPQTHGNAPASLDAR